MKRLPLFCLVFLTAAGAAYAAEGPLKVRVSAAGGFDNNRGLNSERKSDFFAQETASAVYSRLLDKKAQYRLSWNALNLNYFKTTDLSLLLNQVGADLNYLLTPQAVWENGYSFQYLYFPDNEAVTSYEHEYGTALRYKVGPKWTVRALASFSWREYEDRKKRGPDRLDVPDERADDTVTGEFSSIHKLHKDLALTVSAARVDSDSNDQYHDYYDYDAWKLSAGVSWQIDAKWTAFAKFAYEDREYDSRPLRDDLSVSQEDRLYTSSVSLYYKVNKDLSLGSVLTYREKESNEPSQGYSGSIGTLGLYYSF